MFNAMIETLKANPRSIVFTEGHDPRILEATARLKAEGFLKVVLVGNVEEVNLQGIFPTQGSNPGLPHRRQTLFRLSHQGSPLVTIPSPINHS